MEMTGWMVSHLVHCPVSAELIGQYGVWVKHSPSSGIVLWSFVGAFRRSPDRQTPPAGLKTEISAFYLAVGMDSIKDKRKITKNIFDTLK